MIIVACKKDSGKTDDGILIEGFKLTDGSGVEVGYYGTADNDWTFNNTLTDREMALFDFPANITIDNITLDNTTEAQIIGNRMYAYPNPVVGYTQYYNVTTSDSVLLKVVVVNQKMNVVGKIAIKVKGSISFSLPYDAGMVPDKSALRFYYSFSSKNKPNYKSGYGDLKICRSGSSLNDCFR